MFRRAARVLRLPPVEQLGILRLAAVRAALEPALRAMPLPRLARLLGLRVGSAGDPPAPPLPPDALSNAEKRALRAADLLTSRGHGERRCLRHALIAGHALRGHRPVLRLGAARRGGATTAHAWIECLGGRIDVDDATEYVPLRAGAGPADPDELLYRAVLERRVLQLRAGPKELLDYVQVHRERITKLNLLLEGETRRALAALDGAKVLDGPGVGEPEHNVVIGVPDRGRAIATLEAVGFRRAGPDLVRSGFDAVLRIQEFDEPEPAADPRSLGGFEPSPPAVVEAMLDLAGVGPGDVVVDLGCGDGRVLSAAEQRGAKAIGYEVDPALADAGRAAGFDVRTTDAAHADLSDATVVTLYVTLEAGLRMQKALKQVVARGGRVVAHHFDLGLWPCTKEIVVDAGGTRRHIRLWASI